MNNIYYNIAHHGRHLFRTDVIMQHEMSDELEDVLCKKFPREEGYTVTRFSTPNVWTVKELPNGDPFATWNRRHMMQATEGEKVLFVLVAFDDGSEREFAIVGSMPVVTFCRAIVERFPELKIKKTTFLDAPANLPRIAEVL